MAQDNALLSGIANDITALELLYEASYGDSTGADRFRYLLVSETELDQIALFSETPKLRRQPIK